MFGRNPSINHFNGIIIIYKLVKLYGVIVLGTMSYSVKYISKLNTIPITISYIYIL